MVLLIASRFASESEGFDWLIFIPAVLIIVNFSSLFC